MSQTENLEEEFENEFKKRYGEGVTASCLVEMKLWWREKLEKIRTQARKEVLIELLELCGSIPVREPLPRLLTALDLHEYADSKGISLHPTTTNPN